MEASSPRRDQLLTISSPFLFSGGRMVGWKFQAFRINMELTCKAMLKILRARLQQYVNCELPDVQAGFRKGRGPLD